MNTLGIAFYFGYPKTPEARKRDMLITRGQAHCCGISVNTPNPTGIFHAHCNHVIASLKNTGSNQIVPVSIIGFRSPNQYPIYIAVIIIIYFAQVKDYWF